MESSGAQYKRFEIISDISDHQYLQLNNSEKIKDHFTAEKNNDVYKKIMQEWKILEKGLPESIYVRAYEERIELLRAVIVGVPGTPYHNGLFFFDICFPTDYPNHPPKVYYHSHGMRLNPNLYETGYVCLSLINTWSGDSNERWDSSSSTILQVLVSIQGLVLNDRPFFNEPVNVEARNKKTKFWVERSMAYNKEVFVLSCKTMIYGLRKPPRNFEGFVLEHFRRCGGEVLAAILAHRDNLNVIGSNSYDERPMSAKMDVSSPFWVIMNKVYFEFKEALGLETEIEEAKETINEKGENERGKTPSCFNLKQQKKGIVKKFSGALKRILK